MNQTDNDKSHGSFKIHNIGFYNLTPRQIKCFSYNKTAKKLAVSRDDASIEIWNMRSAVFMEKCILGQPSWSVEGLGWLGNRLFSTGQSGELIEWDLKELKQKTTKTLTGNASWCMDVDNVNSCIAVGTQEGYMNTFFVQGEDVNFSKLFDKQEGAFWCCKYDSTGRHIVTGSTDTIRVWNVSSGHVMHRMATGRSEKNKETIVWSLVVLKDLTIIAGDSRGFITIWNGENGSRIDSNRCLEADVLAVAVNDEETFFCCCGIDPKIKIFVPITKTNDTQRRWIRNLTRSVHDHDVKALTFIEENKIVSGGVDGYINVTCATKDFKFSPSKFGPFLPQPCAVVAMPSRLMLLKHFNYVQVWRLGRPNDVMQWSDDTSSRKFYSMHTNQEYIIEWRSRNGVPITCASISPDGLFLIVSTESSIQLFQMDTQTKKPSLTKVLVASDKFTPCARVLFSSDSKFLYCVKGSGDIEIFALSYNDDVDFKATISTQKVLKDTINLICLSRCGKYLACAGTCGSTVVWKYQQGGWNIKTKFPNLGAVTALAINGRTDSIVFANSDYKIFEFNLTSNDIVCATGSRFNKAIEKACKNKLETVITNILLDENDEDFLILHNDSTLFVLKKYKSGQSMDTPSLTGSIKRRKDQPLEDPVSADLKVYYERHMHFENYKHLVHLAWLSPKEIVAVKVDPVTLIEQLPPSMKKNQFGIS